MPIILFPPWIVQQYDLLNKVVGGFVYLQMRKAVWGLPQAGILANKRLRRKLAPFGYSESTNTPGFWTHRTRPISFTLVVDDFGVKYVGKEHALHLKSVIEEHYKFSANWTGNRYIGITIDWDYANRKVHLSMPGYKEKALKQFQHKMPSEPQHSPCLPNPSNMAPRNSTPLHPLLHHCWTRRAKNSSNKYVGNSSSLDEPSTLPSYVQSVPLPPSRRPRHTIP